MDWIGAWDLQNIWGLSRYMDLLVAHVRLGFACKTKAQSGAGPLAPHKPQEAFHKIP